MTIKRVGGQAPKWDRLHEQEIREVKRIVEQLAGKEFESLQLRPLFDVLGRWASHRYKVCRNNAWQEEKKRRGGRAVAAGAVLPAPDVARETAPVIPEEERLPWD